MPMCLKYAFTCLCVLGLLLSLRKRRQGKLPPGPPSRLFLGNAHHISRITPWIAFQELSKTYGPILCFRMFNLTTIVLNKYRAALDLLEHRSSLYANRPDIWMVTELGGRKHSIFWLKSNNPRFKVSRRLLHKVLNPNALGSWESSQMQEVRTLLQGLRQTPDDFLAHLRRNAVAIMMKGAYGYQVDSNDDHFVALLEESFKLSNILHAPGYLVEFFPILRFVPEWFPGAGFKRLARSVGERMAAFERTPFQWSKDEIATGSYQESFVSQNLQIRQIGETQAEKEDIVKWCAMSLYAGGGETTVSVLTTFFLLMTLYPEIQKRAQKEIDSVLGGGIPTLKDRETLPYVNAVLKETLRWGPVAPLGISHSAYEDDLYEGYFIPKGARVVANIWAIAHDEEEYPNPTVFDPSRFLGEHPQLDPAKYVFGFGRRSCPGIHLAHATLSLNVANVLAHFNITKKKDQDGKDIEPEIEWVTAPTTHLKPFQCSITPREREAMDCSFDTPVKQL